ncbi:MAG: DUF4231 domain-containing protein [Clostridiales bacterium]|nr:DUF4231 domain-containing protein [Clostridiales bacterium]
MLYGNKIPVVVGVTGHRNIVEEDKPAIKAQVIESLNEIKSLCKGKDGADTPVIMLNAFAQGADMLCAEAALGMGIDVYAVLPCEEERYVESFDDEKDRGKLSGFLARCKRKFVAPDTERNKEWLTAAESMDDESYEYRQLGIYIAEHSHILIALWDGKPPKVRYGCGTVEVINFALEDKFLDKDRLFKPGMINDSAVVWIKSRRQGDGDVADIKRKWLISGLAEDGGESYGDYRVTDNPPEFLRDMIKKTVDYNLQEAEIPDDAIKLWKNVGELDGYRRNLRYHYAKADNLSYNKNQTKYNLFVLLLAIIGTVVACTFLIYDDAALPFMIFPCTAAIGLIIWLTVYGNRKGYQKNYIQYRALAEALRIQFYMSMCTGGQSALPNVCELYSWSQKTDMIWIEKAIQALAVVSETEELNIDATDVIEVWIGNSEKPTGQLKYHTRKKAGNRRQAEKYEKLSQFSLIATVCIYFIIFTAEVAACIFKACNAGWFWEGEIFAGMPWRSFAAIVLGIATAASLLFSSYWGKLSFDRKADDNEKMSKFYASAYARWQEVRNYPGEAIEKFVKEVAREEIVENGIWCSYVNENRLEINI